MEEYRVAWGLDRPLYVQYLTFIGRALQGDLGVSFTNDLPVVNVISENPAAHPASWGPARWCWPLCLD